MFNIQNYITRLILNKLERYLLNIKADEFQLSLWQGELCFTNLDLNLEVLDQELDISPFSFTSGKIEKLSVVVPWTKIASEPIVISINTMEFVVKRNQQPTQPKPKIKPKPIQQNEEVSGGYMAALINKILNNISVVCNNIVLKYVEEYILVSMNIQHLSVYSADEKWKRAFIEVGANKILARKLINIIDLTICLDKRNSTGKIDYCQEPVLYKCSMELRLFRKFTAYSPNKMSITRVEVHTNNVNMNISSFQLPMLIRLYELIIALRSGKLNQNSLTNSADQSLENLDNDQNPGESWLSYMWNLLPEIFPEEDSHDHLEMDDKKIFEFGFYAEDIKITFKTQETYGESIVPSIKKVSFKPLLEIHFQEVYCLTIICGIRKFNVKCGVSFMEIVGVDDCPCGNKLSQSVIVYGGIKQKNCSYLKDSFLDPKAHSVRKYDDIWPNYYKNTSKEMLLTKTPAFCVDIYHTIEIPDDAKSSDIGSDYEFSNFPEVYKIRMMANGLYLKVTSDAIHRIEKLMTYNDEYEYPKFFEENTAIVKSSSQDDLLEVPIKTYELNFSNTIIHLLQWDHDKLQRKRKLISDVHDPKKNSCIELKIHGLLSTVDIPLYVNRLVNHAIKLPDTNNDLFERCFIKIDVSLDRMIFQLKHHNAMKICEIDSIRGSLKKLLRSELWTDPNIHKEHYTMSMEKLTICVNSPQIQTIQALIRSHIKRSSDEYQEHEIKAMLIQAENRNLVILEAVLSEITGVFICTSTTNYVKGCLDHLQMFTWIPVNVPKKALILNCPDVPFQLKKNEKSPFMTVNLQFPRNFQDLVHAPMICAKVISGSVNFDPLLKRFLLHYFGALLIKADKTSSTSDKSRKLSTGRQRQLSVTSEKSTKKSLNQLPSVHSSSDCDETLCQNQENEEIDREEFAFFDKWYSMCRLLLFDIEIEPITIYYTTNEMNQEVLSSDTINNLLNSEQVNDVFVLNLPIFSISSKWPDSTLANLTEKHFPANISTKEWSKDKSWFPWKIDLSNFKSYTIQQNQILKLIEPITTNICLSIMEENKCDGKDDKENNTSCSLTVIVDSEQITLHLHHQQIELLKSLLDSINQCFVSTKPQNSSMMDSQKSIPVIKENMETVTEVREILDIIPNSSNTTTKNSVHNETSGKVIFSPFKSCIQLICSKITLTLYNEERSKKFVMAVDDIMYSLDKQSFFSKVKIKVDKTSGIFYECESDENWKKNNILGFNILENIEKNETFLVMTLTKAGTKNVHMRWGTYKKNRPLNKYLAEVDATLQQIDLFVNFHALSGFLPLINTLNSAFSSNTQETSEPLSVSELPLVLLKSSGLRVFMSCLKDDSNHKSTNVSILKIDEILIDPKVENPIDRLPLRPDLFTKAAQLGILNTAGSKLENRQYQLFVKNVSLSTSNWETIVDMINTQTISKTYDNPAFQWNNQISETKIENCQLETIFSKLNCSVIYAPCINFKKVLICGTALEFNFISDVNIDINLVQLSLFLNVFKELQDFKSQISPVKSVDSVESSFYEAKEEYIESINLDRSGKRQSSFTDKRSLDDSGVESFSNRRPKDRSSMLKKQSSTISKFTESFKSQNQTIPYDITFYSAIFYINCQTPESTVFMVIDNPNLLISQNSFEKSVIVSLFDLKISLDSKNNENLFHTRPGDLDTGTGVPNPLFRVKYVENTSKSSELDVNVKRPVKFDLSHTKLKKMQKIAASIQAHSGDDARDQNGKKTVPNGKKFNMIKSYFNDLGNVNVVTSQILLKLADSRQYNFKTSIASVKFKSKVFKRPEKIELAVDVNNLTVRNENMLLLHPMSMQFKLKIVQEYWKKDPLFHLNVNSNFIRVDVSAISLKNVMILRDSFMEILENSDESTETTDIKKSELGSDNPLIELSSDKIYYKTDSKSSVEHYQDDLRAGAFQFVETTSMKDLPLPYQIQIVDREIGVICWRYPQPRALQRIKIFPVPFHTLSHIEVTCKIEYYSTLKNCFEEFCEFALTENETKMLELKNTRLCSEIWRIKIPKICLKRDSDFEDDYDDDETDGYEFRMHPKVLVACLRIDSYFATSIIPDFDFFVDIKNIEVNLLNNIKSNNDFKKMEESMPETIKTFYLMDDRVHQHIFLRNQLSNLKVMGLLMDENYQSYEIETIPSAQIVDYGSMDFTSLIDPFCSKILVDFNHEETNLNMLIDEIPLKFSSSIGQALLVSKKLWERNLQVRDSLKVPELIIHTRFVICNNTIFPISFGQCGTNETISLMPWACSLYAFRSNKFEQKIQLAICEKNEWSEKSHPIAINRENTEFLHLIDNQYFIISIKNISSTQKKVVINGQVSVFNMSKEIFRVIYKVYDKTIDNADKCEAREFELRGNSNISVFGKCFDNSQHSLRLKIAKLKGARYSGDIPLKEIYNNSKPWIVKVPSQAKGGHTTYWVRIIRQTVTLDTKEQINRILVVIWPLFLLRSVLPMNCIAREEEIDEKYEILGRGEMKEFEMSETHENSHQLEFDANFWANGEDKKTIQLSYNFIDKNSFFKVSKEFTDINAAIESLEKAIDENWPCSREEELRIFRENSQYENTMPIYNYSTPFPNLSCSLMCTVAPWCMLINSTSVLVKMTNFIDKKSCMVKPNDLMMPFLISELFTISVEIEDNWVQSEPIYINTDIKKSISNSFVVPIEGSTIVTLHSERNVIQLLLTSLMENNTRIMILSTQFVITNFTDVDVQVWPFAIDSNERVELIAKNEYQFKSMIHLYKNTKKNEIKGNPVISFRDLSKIKGKRKFNLNYNFFIAIALKGGDLSCPIFLNKPVIRKCFNVQNGKENVPLCLSIVKYQEQFYISIHEDRSPLLAIKNDTDFNLFVAQTDLANPNVKTVDPRKESVDDRFQWHQIICAKTMVYYTPPLINDHFPEIHNLEYGLIFACVSGDNIRWSQPVKIDDNKKIIFSVPLFGDLSLVVDIRKKTAHIQINYIGLDSEFNVKDVRRQLMHPTTSSDFVIPVHNPENVTDRMPYLEMRERYKKTSYFAMLSGRKRRLNVAAFVKGVNVTLLEDSDEGIKIEVISINVDDIGFHYQEHTKKIAVNFQSIQIDNQLYSSGEYDFPVVMCNKDIENRLPEFSVAMFSIWELEKIFKKQTESPFCSLTLNFYEDDFDIESIHMAIKPIRVYIEDTFINVILDLVDECIPNNLLYKNDLPPTRIILPRDLVLLPKIVVDQAKCYSEPIYLKSIKLEPVHVMISVHTCIRLYIALDHSPLDFSAYEKQNIYTLPVKFGNSVGMHYLSGALFGAGWVVGSLEILGSPSGLARSFTSGFIDFVSMPVQGLFKGPWGFLVGLTHGSASLVKNVTTGTVNSVTKLATSVARNLDRLTLDNEHINYKTDASRRHRPVGLTDGLGKGLTGLGISMLSAVGGLAHHPLQAHSTVEVFTGVGKGIVGVFTKPISGAAEFIALTGQGVLQSVGYNVLPHPVNRCQLSDSKFVYPVAEKIIYQQLPQFVHSNMILFGCRASFSRKSGLKECFLILLTNLLVIADYDSEQVHEVILLEKIFPSAKESENLVILKVKDNQSAETSPKKIRDEEEGQEYHVSSRTYEYVKQLTGFMLPSRKKSESDEETSSSTNTKLFKKSESPELLEVDNEEPAKERKYLFYVDDLMGKYLINYINMLRYDIASKKNTFSLFKIKPLKMQNHET